MERASQSLLDAVGQRRSITWATEGSDVERYLNFRNAEAASLGPDDIFLRPDPSKAAVLEEFLLGTQHRLGIVDRLGTSGLGSAETHVKDFMIRHQRMLGLGDEDMRPTPLGGSYSIRMSRLLSSYRKPGTRFAGQTVSSLAACPGSRMPEMFWRETSGNCEECIRTYLRAHCRDSSR